MRVSLRGKKIHGSSIFLLSSLLAAASALGAADPPPSASELPADPGPLLYAQTNHFPLVTLGEKSGTPEPVEVNLGQILVPIPHRGSAVAIRIQTPKAPLQDFAWAFSAPKDWHPFYFGASEGTNLDSLSWLEARPPMRTFLRALGTAGPSIHRKSKTSPTLVMAMGTT